MNDAPSEETNTATPAKAVGLMGMLLRGLLPMAILAGGGYAYWVLSVETEATKSPPAKKEVLKTRVVELQIQDYPVVIETNGIVQSHNDVILNAQVSGLITNVHPAFEVGSYFNADDLLVELDDSDYLNAMAMAKARYLSAWSSLELAVENLKRETSLFSKSYGSEAAVSRARATREQASADLDSAKAQLERAERDLERTKIRAPFAGRVLRKSIGIGQTVGPGTALGSIFAIDYAEVRLPIAAYELQHVSLPELPDDPPIDVELRSALSKGSTTVWPAQIVRTEGALNQDSLELFAIARIDDPFGRVTGLPPLRIGQPVVGSIIGKSLKDVVALPRAAVRQLDQVFFVDKKELTLSSRTIEPLWSSDEHVVIRDPRIQNGALLATTRLVYPPDGAKVEIIPDIELTASSEQTKTAIPEPVAK